MSTTMTLTMPSTTTNHHTISLQGSNSLPQISKPPREADEAAEEPISRYIERRNEYLSLLSLPFTNPHEHLELYHECIFFILYNSPSFPLVLFYDIFRENNTFKKRKDTSTEESYSFYDDNDDSASLYGADFDSESDAGPIPPDEHKMLLELLEDATSGFGDERKLYSSKRYCELWEIYAELLEIPVHEPCSVDGTSRGGRTRRKRKAGPTPLSVFEAMHALGVGERDKGVQMKYVRLLEAAGRYKISYQVYQTALQRGVLSPRDVSSYKASKEASFLAHTRKSRFHSEFNWSKADADTKPDSSPATWPHKIDPKPDLPSDDSNVIDLGMLWRQGQESSREVEEQAVKPMSSSDESLFSTDSGLWNADPDSENTPSMLHSASSAPSMSYSSGSSRTPSHLSLQLDHQQTLNRPIEDAAEGFSPFLDEASIIQNRSHNYDHDKQHRLKRVKTEHKHGENIPQVVGSETATFIPLKDGHSFGSIDRLRDQKVDAAKLLAVQRMNIPLRSSRHHHHHKSKQEPSTIGAPVTEYSKKIKGPPSEVMVYRSQRRGSLCPVLPSPLSPSSYENPLYYERLRTMLTKKNKLPRAYRPLSERTPRQRALCEMGLCATSSTHHCLSCHEDARSASAGSLGKSVMIREHKKRVREMAMRQLGAEWGGEDVMGEEEEERFLYGPSFEVEPTTNSSKGASPPPASTLSSGDGEQSKQRDRSSTLSVQTANPENKENIGVATPQDIKALLVSRSPLSGASKPAVDVLGQRHTNLPILGENTNTASTQSLKFQSHLLNTSRNENTSLQQPGVLTAVSVTLSTLQLSLNHTSSSLSGRTGDCGGRGFLEVVEGRVTSIAA